MTYRRGAALLGALACWACASPDIGAESEAIRVCADGPTVSGIDVSHWDGAPDWDAMAAGPTRFAFVRVSDGLNFYDDQFDRNWPEARRVGLYRGVYQYFRASQDPIAQADLLLTHMGQLEDDDLPPVIDVETSDGVSLSEVQHAIRAWLDHVEQATGRRAIVYAGLYSWPDHTGALDVLPRPLWVPQYGPVCPDIPAPWTRWTFFQDTSTGTVDGIDGPVDINLFNGDEDSLRAFIGIDAICGDDVCSTNETHQGCAIDCAGCDPIPALGRRVEENELCFEKWGPAAGFRTVPGQGSGGSLIWTHVLAPPTVNSVYWNFDFDQAGRYRLEVSTPAPYGETRMAPYTVRHAGREETVRLDQSAQDGWQVLGEYDFAAAGDQWVELEDGTGEPATDMIQEVFDAVRLTRLDPMPDAGAGADAGPPIADAGADAPTIPLRNGCGCHAAGADGAPFVAWFVALFALGLRTRRRAG